MLKFIFFLLITNTMMLSLKASHPGGMAILLMIMSLLISSLVFKMSFSWFFFLLVLVFLGGVMVIIIYMTSLAANEKTFFLGNSGYTIFPLIIVSLLFMDSDFSKNLNSSQKIVSSLYEQEFIQSLLVCFVFLLLALISVVKLMKLEEGPLVKRL